MTISWLSQPFPRKLSPLDLQTKKSAAARVLTRSSVFSVWWNYPDSNLLFCTVCMCMHNILRQRKIHRLFVSIHSFALSYSDEKSVSIHYKGSILQFAMHNFMRYFLLSELRTNDVIFLRENAYSTRMANAAAITRYLEQPSLHEKSEMELV